MNLSELLPENQISADLTGKNKFQLIEELLDLINGNGKILNRELALKDVLAREGYLSTGLENGLAIPHAKTDGVDQLVMSFGLRRDGADFDSLDREPVYFVFLLVGPPAASTNHLKTLARISRLVQHTDFISSIQQADTVDDILKILAEEDGKHAG